MEIRCNICGKLCKLEKGDKDYERLEEKTTTVYICPSCNKMLNLQSAHNNEVLKKNY